jgi:GNAT superfamily N-acetyltransferase
MSSYVDADTFQEDLCTDGSPRDGDRVMLRDGSSVMILPLTAGDEAPVVDWFATRFGGLSPEMLYARCFGLLQYLDPRVHPCLRDADRDDHETITALGLDRMVVGIARFLRLEDPRSAELTVSVSDDWQRRGLASVLLDRLAVRARSVGIKHLTASCLANQLTFIRLLGQLGTTTIEQPAAGAVDVRIRLS